MTVGIEQIVFYVFAAITVGAAVAVITVRNPVHAALWLVLTFFSCAVIWLLLEAEFLAIALVLVYVGAVMVLFLFVVMMLDVNLSRMREGFIRYLPVGLAVAIIMLLEMLLVVGANHFGFENFGPLERYSPDVSNTAALGKELYTHFVFPFEVAAVILLVAIVAAIALSLRRRPGVKYQNVPLQVQVTKEDRLRRIRKPKSGEEE